MSPENAIQAPSDMTPDVHADAVPENDSFTPTEEAAANAIEVDFETLFARWGERGFPRNVVAPMAFVVAVDAAKRSGISFESAVETLKLIWHGASEPS
jgi:hypothetical protein